jgi:hypothetical protein
MDDKGLFTPAYLETAAAASGFEPPIILSDTWHEAHFREYTTTMFDDLERAFSPEMKREPILEGMIVLKKGV